VKRGGLVDDLLVEEPGVQEGVLGEQALAEAVDGGDGGLVEAEQRPPQLLAGALVDDPGVGVRRGGGGAGQPVVGADPLELGQLGPDPLHQLGGGLLGEGDHQDLLQLRAPPQEQVHHQVLEHVRLPGARRGLHHRVAVAQPRQRRRPQHPHAHPPLPSSSSSK
jgi:hypothetical protein